MAKLAVERKLSLMIVLSKMEAKSYSRFTVLGYHIILTRVLCHSNRMITSLTEGSLFQWILTASLAVLTDVEFLLTVMLTHLTV